MEAIFDKGSSLKWKSRHWKFKGHELLQGIKKMKCFDQFNNESFIKYHYNLFDIKCISFDKHKSNVLIIEFHHKDYNNHNNLHLRFKHHSVFITWFKIFCAYSMDIKSNKIIPIISSISYALYHILQKLYFHKNILSTPYIFSFQHNKCSKELITDIISNLLTESNDVNYETITCSAILKNDINVLSQSLIYLLYYIEPYCLFGHHQIESLHQHIHKLFKHKYAQFHQIDISEINETKIINLKDIIYNEYKTDNNDDIDNINRYAFLSILFNLLHKISINCKVTKMSYNELAKIFCIPLESKLYLHKISKIKNPNPIQKEFNDKYRSLFLIKVLIFYANLIFPVNKQWKVSQLIKCQGIEEKLMTEYDRKHSHKYLDMDDVLNKELLDNNNKSPIFINTMIDFDDDHIDSEKEIASIIPCHSRSNSPKQQQQQQQQQEEEEENKENIMDINKKNENNDDKQEEEKQKSDDDELSINMNKNEDEKENKNNQYTEALLNKSRSPKSPKRLKSMEKRRIRNNPTYLSCRCSDDEKIFCVVL